MPTRAEIADSAARRLSQAQPRQVPAVLGLDGFVDSIIEVVDKRQSATEYQRMKTIADFGHRILAAAGESSNYEFVVTRQKLGGNGTIMANALASIGFDVSYVGSLGFPATHPVFADLCRHARAFSIAEPGYTDAVEFLDGKLMFGKHGALRDVNWENLCSRLGLEKFREMLNAAGLIAMVNWTMLPHLSDIWQHLLTDLFPTLSARPGGRHFFVDMADPEKRTPADLLHALKLLHAFQPYVDVILGLNLKESDQVARVLGIAPPEAGDAAIARTAAAIRQKLDIATVVIHPRRGAAAADRTTSAAFAGPFTEHPLISTGAGDHFNAGFVTGRLLGLDLAESLAAGTAVSGYYVRHAASPTLAQLTAFLRGLPAPEA